MRAYNYLWTVKCSSAAELASNATSTHKMQEQEGRAVPCNDFSLFTCRNRKLSKFLQEMHYMTTGQSLLRSPWCIEGGWQRQFVQNYNKWTVINGFIVHTASIFAGRGNRTSRFRASPCTV